MIVAIHQPNFLPWLGYFYKMLMADIFVFLDCVPFSKGGYTDLLPENWSTLSESLSRP